MGSFGRALEQPSFAPNPSRPKIVGTIPPPPVSQTGTNEDSYQGNNDGYSGDNTINPSFLSIRATSAFLRADGVTKAVIGEPLVKTKFALKYLTWITYQGPSGTRSAVIDNSASGSPGNNDYDIYQLENAYGISNSFLQQGTAANILAYFGLTYSSSTHAWVYNHGQTSIMTLSAVATANRDPDFAELLKAAICAGSLGKAGPNLNVPGGTTNYQYSVDCSLDYQVLQIMANLIDQQKADSYPTRIEIGVPGSSGYFRSFFGVKDLPYFYRYLHFMVVDTLPVDTAASHPGTSTFIGKAQSGIATGSVTTPGDAAYVIAAEVWNPHDPSGVLTSPTNRPTLFRLTATSDDPLSVLNPAQAALTPVWKLGTSDDAQPTLFRSTPAALNAANTAMTFSDANGSLFREPTMLWKPNLPLGSNLNAPFGTLTEANTTPRKYCGVIGGKVPAEVVSSGTIYQVGQVNPNNNNIPSGGWQQLTFMLEYQDPLGNWIPYDVKYPDLHGLYSPTAIVNSADYTNGSYEDPFNNDQVGDHASGFDPRTARFGVGTETSLGEVSSGTQADGGPKVPYVLEPTANANFNASTLAQYTAIGNSGFTIQETQRSRGDKGDQTNYSNPCMTSNPGKMFQMRWFSGVGLNAAGGAADQTTPLEFDGLLSENDSLLTFLARDKSTTAHFYFEDADGVNRRAMGAYAPQAMTDSTTSSLYSSGNLNRVAFRKRQRVLTRPTMESAPRLCRDRVARLS